LYVTQRRDSDRIRIFGTGVISGAIRTQDYTVPRFVEGVYTWRTGRHAISDPPVVPPRARDLRGEFGIAAPTQRGNLLDRYADRKRYTEDLLRAAFPAETATGSVSASRTSTTDSGHLFASVKVLRQPWLVKLDVDISSSSRWSGLAAATCDQAGIYNPGPYGMGFPGETTQALQPFPSNNLTRQGMANRYFASTAPDRNDASLLVTAVELLRGDIPSVLKNFQEMMAGLKSIRNFLGSDFLNITFGWTPLIQEYANVIKVGLALDRAIYGESFRRKRQWEGPSISGHGSQSAILNTSGRVYNQATLEQGTYLSGSGFGSAWTVDQTWVESEDYHWSSRYAGLAKAGRAANLFGDQAADVLKRLGLVDDPRLLWDLTPYSWLVDWFTTMGDSISNANTYAPITGKYSVDYAYLTTNRVFASKGTFVRGPASDPKSTHTVVEPHSMYSSRTRWRDRATPFGFGTQLASLNATQYGILVALGLARGR